MQFSPLLNKLLLALQCLPGVGPRTAQRMAFQLLERERQRGLYLAEVLNDAMQHLGNCNSCRILTEADICGICIDPKRDHNILCLVESPSDVAAIEQAGGYRGVYFVLMGHLSPINGIGPKEIGIELLQQRLANRPPKEVILATSSTVEGEATAYYIAELLKDLQILTTRIAHGVPMGGELKFLDVATISQALQQRHAMS